MPNQVTDTREGSVTESRVDRCEWHEASEDRGPLHVSTQHYSGLDLWTNSFHPDYPLDIEVVPASLAREFEAELGEARKELEDLKGRTD